MDAEAIDLVFESLQDYRWGWRTTLPSLEFIGQPVGLRIDTQPIPISGTHPLPDAAEMALVRLVLGALPQLLIEIERQYRAHADSPDIINRVHEPHIWVSRHMLQEEGQNRWSFIVRIADAQDWGIHCEFEGLDFLEIWSGD